MNLGLIDIYRLLGTYSSLLQTVGQFPWIVVKRVRELIKYLRDMSKIKLKPTDVEGGGDATSTRIDKKSWPRLTQHLDSVLTEQYHGLSTGLAVERKRGRSAADMGNNDVLLTVENRLSSLCKNLA